MSYLDVLLAVPVFLGSPAMVTIYCVIVLFVAFVFVVGAIVEPGVYWYERLIVILLALLVAWPTVSLIVYIVANKLALYWEVSG